MQENRRLQSAGGVVAEAVRRMTVTGTDGVKVRAFALEPALLLHPCARSLMPVLQVLDSVFGLPFEIKKEKKRQLSPYRLTHRARFCDSCFSHFKALFVAVIVANFDFCTLLQPYSRLGPVHLHCQGKRRPAPGGTVHEWRVACMTRCSLSHVTRALLLSPC